MHFLHRLRFLNRCLQVVKHFQDLFDVPKIEHVLPCMNRLFSRHNELVNFYRALLQELRLESDCSTSRVLTTLKVNDILVARFESISSSNLSFHQRCQTSKKVRTGNANPSKAGGMSLEAATTMLN